MRSQHDCFDPPERQREVPNCLDAKDTAARVALERVPVSLVGDYVFVAEPLVKDQDSYCAEHGEQRDDR